MTTQTITLPIKKIHDSPFNPEIRADVDDEFVASIKVHGVLTKPLVRPVNDSFELVFGHRRKYGAIKAGLKDLEVEVREIDDKDVIELQLVENLQREGLDPLDEAMQFKKLNDMGVSGDEIAARTGKHRSYVYGRLKLCDLVPEGVKAYRKGKITAEVALKIARIPASLQAQAVEDLTKGDEPMSVRAATEIIQRRYMLQLANAPFDTRDANLVPAAGSCAKCPKRTGNQPDLFSDVKSKDTCTDSACFDAKREASWEMVKADAAEKGREVLSEKDAKKVLAYGVANPTSGYVDLEAKVTDDAKGRTYGDLLAKRKDSIPIAIARDPHTGKVHELVKVEVASDVLPKKLAPEAPKDTTEKDKLMKEASRAAAQRALSMMSEKGEAREFDKAVWLLLVEHELDGAMDTIEDVLVRKGLLAEDADDKAAAEADEKFRKSLERKTAAELRGLWIELHFAPEARYFMPTPKGTTYMERAAAALRIDMKDLVAEETKRIKDDRRAKSKAKKGDAADAAAE